MRSFAFSGLLTAALLSGCASWFESPAMGPPAELVDLENPVEPSALWRRDIGVGTKGQQLGLRPAIDAERVYVANVDGDVVAVDVANGDVIWRADTGAALSGGPGLGAGLLLLGTTEAEVIALDPDNGEEQWRTRVSSEVLSAPAAAVATVVVQTIDGRIHGLDSTTGEERWRYEREVPVLTLRGSASPIIDGRLALSGLAGGKLVALDLETGVPVWEANVTVPSGRSELERLADIDGDPLVYAGVVYAATFQGEVAAVGATTGNLLWRRQLSTYNGLSADWRQVYVSDDQGFVWALDADTGAARWRQEALRNRRLSPPAALLGEHLVVGDFEGYLHWLAPEDGRLIGRVRIGSDPITAAPRVRNNVVYVLGDGGELAAIRAPEAR